MKLHVLQNPQELGKQSAQLAAKLLNEAIAEQGEARLLLSTGASQFEFFNQFVKEDIDWSKVEMFHLDEYVGLPESHPASFRKYLRERFLSEVTLKNARLVNGEGDVQQEIQSLNEEISKKPIDVALIGIGENAHIAFNDPPANFETKEPFIVVDLDDACKNQQVREGWFPSLDDVPKQAISMSVHQILQSKVIISCVPYEVKAQAVYNTLTEEISPLVPATKLKEHADWHLFLDQESASLLPDSTKSGE